MTFTTPISARRGRSATTAAGRRPATAAEVRDGSGPADAEGPSSAITSARVAALSLNRPRTADVTVSVPGLRTPRIDMHRCSASIITNAPRGCSTSTIASAICVVSRSCTCGRLRETVDEARQLRQTGDAAVVARDVRDMRMPVERREMVLALAVERDVAHHHHLVVVRFERDDQVARRVLVQTAEDLGVHLGDAPRCALRDRRGRDPRRSRRGSRARPSRCVRCRCRWSSVWSITARCSRGPSYSATIRQVAIPLADVEPVADHELRRDAESDVLEVGVDLLQAFLDEQRAHFERRAARAPSGSCAGTRA